MIYLSDLACFRKAWLVRSWKDLYVCGSAEIPWARLVLGPMIWALGSTDWHLCSFLFSSWISSSFSTRRLSMSFILSSFSTRSLVNSPCRSLIFIEFQLKLFSPPPAGSRANWRRWRSRSLLRLRVKEPAQMGAAPGSSYCWIGGEVKPGITFKAAGVGAPGANPHTRGSWRSSAEAN